jgi:RNA-directed DNA polymerase
MAGHKAGTSNMTLSDTGPMSKAKQLSKSKSRKPLMEAAYQKARILFGVEFADEISTHAATYEGLLRQFERALSKGKSRKARGIQDLILKSYSSKLVCLIRSLGGETSLTVVDVRAIAKSLNPFKDCGEEIFTWADPKSSGYGWRPICAFQVKRKALQILCCDILLSRFGIESSNFLRKGKGAERASDEIVRLIGLGFSHFVLTDIKNCFRSVQIKGLHKALGLPEAVVRNCLLIGPNVSLSLSGDMPNGITLETLDGAAREGVPQGSRASQLVVSILLGPTLRQLASVDCTVVVGDDVAIAAHSKKEANALLIALEEALKLHPFGPFRLKRQETVRVYDGFDFLQYRHKKDWLTDQIWRHPASASYDRYSRKVTTIAATGPPLEALKRIARYRYHWMKSFNRWRWNFISKLLLWQTTVVAMEKGGK